ncbi:MAG: BTAD domain-containing putative transcriptional regulator [Clostridium sp.]|nr:BTAD domain-containing putative transcriptional regulator [Clostridium sp.]
MSKEDVLHVRMLGEQFCIYLGSGEQVHEIFTSPMLRGRSIKLLQLLAVLLFYHGRALERSRLLEMLYGEEYDDAAATNFRAVVYRLRKMLPQMGLPEEEYILSQKGTYRWNEDAIKLDIDAERFEQEAKQALVLGDDETAIRALKGAVLNFRGDFLRLFETESWVVEISLHYHRLLEQCMEKLQVLLKKRERHEEIVSICGKLLTVSQEETWYSYQIQAYLDMKKTDMAYRTYEQAVRILVDQLKHPPSQDLMNLFSSLNKRVDKSLETIKEIREMLYDEIESGKAYYCGFPSFIDAYRLAGRLMQRNGQSSFLILCTITDENGNAIENQKKLEKISEQFQETLITSLRSSDLVTRYNMSQYLLLLNGIVREDCSLVTTRIERNFRKKGITGNYYINYYISSVLDKPPLSMMTESH